MKRRRDRESERQTRTDSSGKERQTGRFTERESVCVFGWWAETAIKIDSQRN